MQQTRGRAPGSKGQQQQGRGTGSLEHAGRPERVQRRERAGIAVLLLPGHKRRPSACLATARAGEWARSRGLGAVTSWHGALWARGRESMVQVCQGAACRGRPKRGPSSVGGVQMRGNFGEKEKKGGRGGAAERLLATSGGRRNRDGLIDRVFISLRQKCGAVKGRRGGERPGGITVSPKRRRRPQMRCRCCCASGSAQPEAHEETDSMQLSSSHSVCSVEGRPAMCQGGEEGADQQWLPAAG